MFLLLQRNDIKTFTLVLLFLIYRNLVNDHLRQTRAQYGFTQVISDNEQFKVYYKERTTAQKSKLDDTLEHCRRRDIWLKMDMLTSSLTCHFMTVHKLCSRENFPLSAYPLLVQGLLNDINRGVTKEFADVLGEEARDELAQLVRERFNMDGKDPSGRKVGLLDRFHFMAYLCDPFGHEWRSVFKLKMPIAILIKEMIELYIPGRDNQERVKKDFMVSIA